MPLFSRFSKPFFGFFFILFTYPAIIVTLTKIILCFRMAQVCCLSKPFYGFFFVFFNSPAIVVTFS